jgi:hypothetical protein
VLGAANSVTDLLMVSVLRGRKYYAQHKYELSMDFSHIRAKMNAAGEAEEDLVRSWSPFEISELLKQVMKTQEAQVGRIDELTAQLRASEKRACGDSSEDGSAPTGSTTRAVDEGAAAAPTSRIKRYL